MAVHEKVPFTSPSIASERVPEAKDGLDVMHVRQNEAWSGFDHVMELQRGPMVRVIRPEGVRLRPVRVQDRENVGDASHAVLCKLIKAADGQQGHENRVHSVDYPAQTVNRGAVTSGSSAVGTGIVMR